MTKKDVKGYTSNLCVERPMSTFVKTPQGQSKLCRGSSQNGLVKFVLGQTLDK